MTTVLGSAPQIATSWQQCHISATCRTRGSSRKENAARALRNLAYKNAANRAAIREAGGIPPLVALLTNGAVGGQEQAARALWNLAFKNAANKVAIVAAGAVDPLYALARAGGSLKAAAVGALKELDLAAIASQLQTLEKASRKRRREEECVRHCVVCHERAREVAFDPCGHFVCCSECGPRVSTCPLCRGAIERNLRIYVG